MCPSLEHAVDLPVGIRTWLEAQLEREVDLPMLPESAVRVIALCDDDDANARDLEQVLERDPSLAAFVLRVANSAAYAAAEPIASLQQAASRLGMSTVRNIALTASLHGRVFDVPGHSKTVHDIWVHCAVTGVFAREIARKLRRNVEAAFLCGLIHDVGRPIVLQTALRVPREHGTLDVAQIQAAMDAYHEQVGAQLAGAWGLADWTAAAVAHHHDPERAAPHEYEARITRLADLLAHWALVPGSGPEDFPVDDPVIVALNLYPEDVDEFLALRESVLVAAEALQ
jgi:putative nucleotidyltransferase with HDIG domain